MRKMLSMVAAAFFIFSADATAAPMSLNVRDADLRSTIMMVAGSGGLNISLDDSVGGKISVALSKVEPKEILEIIAKTSNLKIIQVAGTYIITAEQNSSVMQSYVLPIRYGDAETLRKAIVMSLDADTEKIPSQMTRTRNNDGSYTYRYSFREEENFSNGRRTSDELKNIKREERVMISPDVNALILFGTPAEYDRAKNLLQTLDVELKQVSVEAKILTVDKNASKNLGIEWFWSAAPQYPEEEIEIYQNSAGIYRERITRERNFSDNTGYGIVQFGRGPEGIPFEWYYGARINALVTNGKAKIISRPNVTTVQGREAIINVSDSVPVPKIETTNSTTTTSIEYRDAGIILRYTPRINADGTITATIHTEVSTPHYVEDLRAYRFNKRTADTTVTMRDGESMVIGGLIGAEESRNISKIPFLGDLPILGALFKNHRKGKSESELIIFLMAHVLKGAGAGVPSNVKYKFIEEEDHEVLSDKPEH